MNERDKIEKAIIEYGEKYCDCKGEPAFENSVILRRNDNKKWLGIILDVKYDRLIPGREGYARILNLKNDPAAIGSLCLEKGIYLGYHMNKANWITVDLEGGVPLDMIFNLMEDSRLATASKRKRK